MNNGESTAVVAAETRPVSEKKVRHRKKRFFRQLQQQMEFYFSDANLSKDKFMQQHLSKDRYMDLSIFLRFNRIRVLTSSIKDLSCAISKSSLLELSSDGTRVARATPVQVKENEDECTVYVEEVPAHGDHDWLRDIFTPYGSVAYVSIPRFRKSGKVKGFAFVEFDTPEAAKRTLEAFGDAGCCIPVERPPADLCSIQMYEGGADGGLGEEYEGEMEDEPEEEEQEEDSENREEEKVAESVAPSEQVSQEHTQSHSKKPGQKRKPQSDEDHSVENKRLKTEVEEREEEKCETEGEGESGEKSDHKKKKKKRRKRNKKCQEELEVQTIGLRILSKTAWKKLRNMYLNLQKQNMKCLKQQMWCDRRHSYQRHPREHPSAASCEEKTDNKRRTNRNGCPQFVPGVIVRIGFEGPVTDVAQFKKQVKSLAAANYIDIREGWCEAHIRCESAAEAQKLASTNIWPTIAVLENESETEYWKKIQQDRTEKITKKIRVSEKRGIDKVINRAQKESHGKHIHFTDEVQMVTSQN